MPEAWLTARASVADKSNSPRHVRRSRRACLDDLDEAVGECDEGPVSVVGKIEIVSDVGDQHGNSGEGSRVGNVGSTLPRQNGGMTTVSPPTTLPALIERGGLWPIRIMWFVLPLLVGPGLLDAVAGRSDPVQNVVEFGAWAAWFIGLVSVMAPSTVTLTMLRTIAPAAVAAPLLGAVTSGDWPVSVLVAVLGGLVANVVAFLPTTGEPMINGSAYGAEKRMALRPPASVLIGPLYLAWFAVFAGVTTGPLLLATKNWWLGVPLTVVGALLAVAGVRSLHQLARRWVVFVPVGFVIHDYWSLAESLLVQRKTKPTLGPARTDQAVTDGIEGDGGATKAPVDLTAGALGLALSLRLPDPMPTALRRKGQVESTTATEFWFSPTRPGRVLAEARTRAITIG